ncbi:MAG: acetate uptake transporter [Thermoplasmata archaeon]
MSAAGMSMETAHGMQEAPPRVEEKPEWWAGPATLGLLGFGTTTILAGLQVGGWIGAGAVLAMAIFFGGIAQIIAGLIGLRKGNMFATAFVCYGAFWLAFNWMLTSTAVPADFYGIAAFMFVWFLVTLTFTLSAPKHGFGITSVFVTLLIAFALLTWRFDALAGGTILSKSTLQGIGAEIILTGLLAWGVATADLTNWNYGRKIIPV